MGSSEGSSFGKNRQIFEDLRCSFCNKPQKKVEKLISNQGVSQILGDPDTMRPRVYICNECVAVCSKIVEESSKVVEGARKPKPIT